MCDKCCKHHCDCNQDDGYTVAPGAQFVLAIGFVVFCWKFFESVFSEKKESDGED